MPYHYQNRFQAPKPLRFPLSLQIDFIWLLESAESLPPEEILFDTRLNDSKDLKRFASDPSSLKYFSAFSDFA